MDIKQYPVKNFDKGRNGFTPRGVCLHITEGSSTSALNWFNDPKSWASSHYLVKENGDVLQLVSEYDMAWGAGLTVKPMWTGLIPNQGIMPTRDGKYENPNQYLIHVEVALWGYALFPGYRQWRNTAELVKWICMRYNWPIDELHVPNHNEIRADKQCPGVWINRSWMQTWIKYLL